jgi:sensor histidine kinase regulating citrate/malate metabolism
MAGAQKLTMMTPTQIYSVFGNIMDNAIRASKMLEKEKRFISLTISESNGAILIEESNFYNGDIRIINESSIETSKANKSKHGYGIKSITYIIDKFHGTTSLSAKDGLFSIKISIPIVNEN